MATVSNNTSLDSVTQYIMRQHGISNRKVAEQMAKQAIDTRDEQARYARAREEARSMRYHDWLRKEFPDMDWESPIYIKMIEYIQAILDGDITQLIINVPPRIGKSSICTVRLPVFWMLREPSQKVLVGAYSKDLARNFSEESLKIYQEITPATVQSSLTDEWTTIYGGMVKAIGVGSSAAGFGADLGLADDPIKSFSEAHSPTYQQMVWQWWLNDFRTRRNFLGRTPTILIHTRWTEEDPTGKILSSSTAAGWEVLTIPAISIEDDPAKDRLGRQKGESILPTRLPIQELIIMREEMGRDFEALYQQNPKSEASYTFKTGRIDVVDEVPIDCDRVRYFDRAGSEGKGDYTVGVLLAQDRNGFVYIEDVVRGQWAPEDVEKQVEQTIKLDAFRYAGVPGRMMQFWIEQEPAASGKQVAYATVRKLAGYEVSIDRPSDNKDVRSKPFAAFVNGGSVRIKKAAWNPAYLEELSLYIAYGKRRYDDQVDASSGAFMKLTIERMVVDSR